MTAMKTLEHQELEAHQHELNADVARLLAKYRAIFGWDVPEIDEQRADALILNALRKALDALQTPPAGD
jgi:hypothetical protein